MIVVLLDNNYVTVYQRYNNDYVVNFKYEEEVSVGSTLYHAQQSAIKTDVAKLVERKALQSWRLHLSKKMKRKISSWEFQCLKLMGVIYLTDLSVKILNEGNIPEQLYPGIHPCWHTPFMQERVAEQNDFIIQLGNVYIVAEEKLS